MVTGDDGRIEEGVDSTPRYSLLGKLIWSRQSQSLLRGQGCFAIAAGSLGGKCGTGGMGCPWCCAPGHQFRWCRTWCSVLVYAGHW